MNIKDQIRAEIDARRQNMVYELYGLPEDGEKYIRVKGMHDVYVDMLTYIDHIPEQPVEWSEDTVPVRFEEEDGEKYPVVDYKLMGQKPAEKQDYSGLNDLERAIHRGFLCAGMENVPVTIIKETAQECLAQMKPAEWSEEDEKMLNRIIETLSLPPIYDTKACAKMVSWLKSLRPQPHWKPSEEQMEVLQNVMKRLLRAGGTGK